MQDEVRRNNLTLVQAALCASIITASWCTESFGQTNSQSQSPFTGPVSGKVTMTLFKIVEQKGKKNLETPTGEFVPISGKHLAKDATMVAVYRDSQSNYWFINKDGKPTSIPPEKVQWAVNQITEQRVAKEQTQAAIAAEQSVGGYSNSGYNSGQAPVQQTTIVEQPASGSGSNALGTGLAAAGGAMVGGLIGSSLYDDNHYWGAPYGAPMYRDNHGGYYMNNGNRVYVNNSHLDGVNNQWAHQGDWSDRDTWSENARDEHSDRGFREGWGGFRGRR